MVLVRYIEGNTTVMGTQRFYLELTLSYCNAWTGGGSCWLAGREEGATVAVLSDSSTEWVFPRTHETQQRFTSSLRVPRHSRVPQRLQAFRRKTLCIIIQGKEFQFGSYCNRYFKRD